MSAIKDGGPAFPVDRAILNGQVLIATGMSLRDYFAAKAMHGVLSGPEVKASAAEFAEYAYAVADAMIACREKGGA